MGRYPRGVKSGGPDTQNPVFWDPRIGGPGDLDAGIWAMAGYAPTVHNRQWRSKGIYGVRPEWEYAVSNQCLDLHDMSESDYPKHMKSGYPGSEIDRISIDLTRSDEI